MRSNRRLPNDSAKFALLRVALRVGVDRCRINACGYAMTQALESRGFYPKVVDGAIASLLPPLATRVATKHFRLFSNVVQGEIRGKRTHNATPQTTLPGI